MYIFKFVSNFTNIIVTIVVHYSVNIELEEINFTYYS